MDAAMNDSIGDIITVAGEPCIITRRFLVTRPVAETEAQRRKRRKLKLPQPSFSYTVLATKPLEVK